MKKLIVFLLALTLTIIIPNTTHGLEGYEFNITERTDRVHDGTTSFELFGEMTYNGVTNNQRVNFLDFDLTDPNIHLISIDNYQDFGYSSQTIEGMIYRYQAQNPNIEVLAGFNGDFYDIRGTQRPSSTYIRDYEVIRGIDNGINLVNVKEDGSVEIGQSKADGYEILVIDNNHEVIVREAVTHLNNETLGDSEVGVYLSAFEGSLPESAVLINASDIKYQTTTLQRAKGEFTPDAELVEISEQQFAIAAPHITERLEEGFTVIVQIKLIGYEDVRSTVGGGAKIVNDGIAINSDNLDQHPRTTLAIREDGSVFVMVANGRDIAAENVPGVMYNEMAQLLLSHGAYQAINLDGGGSSTLVVREEDGSFKTLNKLSDGRFRSVSNGFLVVRGDIDRRPIEILGEDNRTPFTTPVNLYLDTFNQIRFDNVANASRYIIDIDGVEYQSGTNRFNLNSFQPREYEAKVKVMGTYEYSSSEFTETYTFTINRLPVSEMIQYLREVAKNSN